MSHKKAVNLAMFSYVGESCKYCDFTAKSIEDLDEKDIVWVGYHGKGRWACKSCFEEFADSDPDNPKNKNK